MKRVTYVTTCFIFLSICILYVSKCAYATDYRDVSSTAWYYNAINYVADNDYMIGNERQEFMPERPITQNEAVVLIARLLSSKKKETLNTQYSDNHWWYPYLEYLICNNIISEAEFRENSLASRGFFINMFTRTIDIENVSSINNIEFIPDLDTSTLYGQNVLALYKSGILTGTDSMGNFSQNIQITRAEVASIIYRYYVYNSRIRFSTKLPSQYATYSLPINIKNMLPDLHYIHFDGYYILLCYSDTYALFDINGAFIAEDEAAFTQYQENQTSTVKQYGVELVNLSCDNYVIDPDLQWRSGLTGYYIYPKQSDVDVYRNNNFGILNSEFDVILEPREGFIYLNPEGYALIVDRPNNIYSYNIFTTQYMSIWEGDVRPEFLLYNDTFIMQHGNSNNSLANQLFDYNGDRLTPYCEYIALSGGSSAVYIYDGSLYLIHQIDAD